jgi:hypothetical protein
MSVVDLKVFNTQLLFISSPVTLHLFNRFLVSYFLINIIFTYFLLPNLGHRTSMKHLQWTLVPSRDLISFQIFPAALASS